MVKYCIGEIGWHRLASKRLEDYDWSGNELAKVMIEGLVARETWDKGLGLVGWTGIGKTHLLVALYKERMYRAVYQQSNQVPVWLPWSELVAEDLKRIKLAELVAGDIVFVDDLWSMGQGDEVKKLVKELVFHCYDTGKVLCFSTNVRVKDWDIDERVADRIREMCVVLELKGDSRRGM